MNDQVLGNNEAALVLLIEDAVRKRQPLLRSSFASTIQNQTLAELLTLLGPADAPYNHDPVRLLYLASSLPVEDAQFVCECVQQWLYSHGQKSSGIKRHCTNNNTVIGSQFDEAWERSKAPIRATMRRTLKAMHVTIRAVKSDCVADEFARTAQHMHILLLCFPHALDDHVFGDEIRGSNVLEYLLETFQGYELSSTVLRVLEGIVEAMLHVRPCHIFPYTGGAPNLLHLTVAQITSLGVILTRIVWSRGCPVELCVAVDTHRKGRTALNILCANTALCRTKEGMDMFEMILEPSVQGGALSALNRAGSRPIDEFLRVLALGDDLAVTHPNDQNFVTNVQYVLQRLLNGSPDALHRTVDVALANDDSKFYFVDELTERDFVLFKATLLDWLTLTCVETSWEFWNFRFPFHCGYCDTTRFANTQNLAVILMEQIAALLYDQQALALAVTNQICVRDELDRPGKVFLGLLHDGAPDFMLAAYLSHYPNCTRMRSFDGSSTLSVLIKNILLFNIVKRSKLLLPYRSDCDLDQSLKALMYSVASGHPTAQVEPSIVEGRLPLHLAIEKGFNYSSNGLLAALVATAPLDLLSRPCHKTGLCAFQLSAARNVMYATCGHERHSVRLNGQRAVDCIVVDRTFRLLRAAPDAATPHISSVGKAQC